MQDSDLSTSLALAPELIAADGGANRALDYGISPRWVVGDMDSISTEVRAKLPDSVMIPVSEQDSTDFDKCLQRIKAPLIIGVGFTGDRLDHQLAVFSGLVRQPELPCIVMGSSDIIFHCPPKLCLTLPIGARVSLFPMQEVRGTSQGLHWPIDGLTLAPGGMIGTSNHADATQVEIQPEGNGLLVILSRAHLEQAVAALRNDG